MIDFVRVGMKITKYRKDANLSQEELAAKLYVTRQALSKWEVGISAPSIDSLLMLSQIFKVSFEDLLCLNDDLIVELDQNDIFKGHERQYIVNRLIDNTLNVNLPDIFYQLSPYERMLVLKGIKEGRVEVDLDELWVKLTISEQKFLGGNRYEIKENYY